MNRIDRRVDVPLQFEMGVFGPAGAVSAFIPGTVARALEHIPFAKGLSAKLYTIAGRWVRSDAEHFMPPKDGYESDNRDYLRGVAAECHLEGAFYFANAGRLQLLAGGENTLRLGLLNYIDAKNEIGAVVEIKDKPEFRLMQARILGRIRLIHHLSGAESGIDWLTKERDGIQQGLSLLKDEKPSQIRSELTLQLIDVGHELSDAHVQKAKAALKASDTNAAKIYLKEAARINEEIGNGLVGTDALEATTEVIDCYKTILTNIHDLSVEETLSTLRSLAAAYRRAGEHYKEMNDLLGSAEMHFQAASALEHAARIRGGLFAEGREEYNEALRDLTSAARAFGESHELKAASDLRMHMRNIGSYLTGGKQPEPLSLGYTFRHPQISTVRSILDGNDASTDRSVAEEMDSIRRLGKRLTPRQKAAFLRHFEDAVGGERGILELERFVREHLNGGSTSRGDAARAVRERGLRRTMEDLFGHEGSDVVVRIFTQTGGPTIDRRAALERRRSLRK